MADGIRPYLLLARDIKIAHSVFALPFAVFAAVLAWPRDVMTATQFMGRLVLVIVAMVGARTVAMVMNRWFDRRIDARNPRTQARVLASGDVSSRNAAVMIAVAAMVYFGAAAAFGLLDGNWWPASLSIPVLIWISVYGLFKRFTAFCHVWLGVSLALSPPAAALAISPEALTVTPSIWWLAGMVVGWVAGFDIIYALQDVESDQRDGLHSVPSRFGTTRALWIARLLHAFSFAALFMSLRADGRLGALYAIGVAATGVLLIIEQATVSRWGTTKMSLTFFTLNGVISCVLGTLGIVDVLV